MDFSNSTIFKVGAYPIAGQMFDHTYVCIPKDENNYVDFCCYGSVSHDNFRLNCSGNERFARTIACFDENDLRNRYDKKSEGYLNLGDSSGIRYGLSGVCHQMTNRILMSCEKNPTVAKVSSSYYFSYNLYGVYGNNIYPPTWEVYIAQCRQKANRTAFENKDSFDWDYQLSESDLAFFKQAAMNASDEFTQKTLLLEIEHLQSDEPIHGKRLQLLLERAYPAGFDQDKANELKKMQAVFFKTLNTISERYDSDSTAVLYTSLNEASNRLISQFRRVLTDDEIKTIFGINPLHEVNLVSEEVFKSFN